MPRNKLREAILKAIIYADIFDYPLKVEEIQKWLIGYKTSSSLSISNQVENIESIQKKQDYYFMKGRESIVIIRNKREDYSQKRILIAQRVAKLLSYIPTIKLIGITGALAMNNTRKDDDIDLFIISSHNFLWTTRFFATFFVEMIGNRRHPADLNTNNKICLNMFMDEKHLAIRRKERDLFSAHEVIQMKLLWEKDNTYKKFLSANKWVKKYLPNAYNQLALAIKPKDTSEVAEGLLGRWRNQQSVLENFLKNIQLWYMNKRRTTEVIKEGMIRFHIHDARKWILQKYYERQKELNLTS